MKWLRKLWDGIPDEESEDRRTRWALTLLSFLMLGALMAAAFVACLLMAAANPEISLALIDLVKHLSYVFGAIVGVYFSIESIWPSSDRPYWGGGGWGGGGWKGKEVDVDPKKQPPVHDSENDAEVQ